MWMGLRVALMSGLCIALVAEAGCLGWGVTFAPGVVKRTQVHMGTLVSITAVASSRQMAQEAASAGFQEVHRLEDLLQHLDRNQRTFARQPSGWPQGHRD